MIRDLLHNLSKNQKIAAFVIIQVVFIVTLVSIFNIFTGEPEHVFIDESISQDTNLPNNAKKFVSENLWAAIQLYVPNIDSDKIKDAVIREGTYEEQENEDGSIRADFIIDIDSLKQTFVVATAWSKDGKTVYETSISCPPKNLMKYTETICYTAYNNTYSLDLYLPHSIMAPHNNDVFDVKIRGDEYERKIYVSVADCNPNKLKQQAMEYLQSTPIKLSEYEIIYDVVNLEYPYFNDDMSETEINNLKEKCKNG